jgi:hypothetical protein
VADLLREGGGHLLSVPRSVASSSLPTGVDLRPWQSEMGRCLSSRADLARLLMEGCVRRQAVALSASRGCAARVDGAGSSGGRRPSSSCRVPRGGEAVCLATTVKPILEVQRGGLHDGAARR